MMESELWQFVKAVAEHWGSLLTGGVLIAGIWLYEHRKGESMPWRFALLLAAFALVVSVFFAWRDQYHGWIEERRYRSRVADDLAGLRHTAQKRYYEWWEACDDPAAAAKAKSAAEELREMIVNKLRTEISAAEADYFNTPRMFEPFPANRSLVTCHEAPLINEFGHRIQRLGDIIQRVLDRGRKEAELVRAIIIAALVALTPLETSAECAWVLWAMYHERGARTSDFAVSATYLSSDHCITRLNQKEESARVIKADDVTRDATTRLYVVSKDKDGRYTRRVDWLCTPDTVDPRGPKASGR